MRIRKVKRNLAQWFTGFRGAKNIKFRDDDKISFEVKLPIDADGWRMCYGSSK